jgi:3-deoxy-D-manno-octulosonic-acid transferase
VDETKILCTGSIKFDEAETTAPQSRDFRPVLDALGVPAGAPILLGGSTHAGEEKILGELAVALRAEFPELFLVIVPRHAERWRGVRDDLVAAGLRVALRLDDEAPGSRPDALVVNTTGELRDWYDVATVVFVGKSLTAHGGQNPAEAVAAGKPVVVGPWMENFATLTAQLRLAGGIVAVEDAAGLGREVADLLRRPDRRAEMAARGRECLAGHLGATARTCDAVRRLGR